jgi:hypothetical protein
MKMKQYKISYYLFGNFRSHKIFLFESKPEEEECKIWLWNIINTYEKNTLDWELTINDIEILRIKEVS